MPLIDFDRRHYQAILDRRPADADHPIDVLISRLPDVAELDDAVRQAAHELRDPAARESEQRWIQYEDLRHLQRAAREERMFDVGFELGRVASAPAKDRRFGNCACSFTTRSSFPARVANPRSRCCSLPHAPWSPNGLRLPARARRDMTAPRS